MNVPVIRRTVDEVTDTIEGGRTLHTWNDLLGVFPGVFGVKTGHTSAAGWSQVAAVRGAGTTIYATILGSPTRSRRNSDLETLLAFGLAQYRMVDAITTGRDYADVQLPYGRTPLALVATAPLGPSCASGTRSPSGSSRRSPSRCPCGRARCSATSRCGPATRLLGRAAARRVPLGRRAWRRRADRLVRKAHRAPRRGSLHVIVTVTLNAAFDRTITVPNFQRGQRHRASAGLPLAGGKGINVARALKTLGVPVVATGLAGGQAGLRIVERLTGEAILNDFVRIEGESRTSTAVVDPTSNTLTEINEWGPSVKPEELEILLEKLALPLAGRRARRLRRLASPRRGGRLLRGRDPRARAPPDPGRARLRRARRCASASRPSRSSSRRTRARRSRSSARSSTTTRTSSSGSIASPSSAPAT